MLYANRIATSGFHLYKAQITREWWRPVSCRPWNNWSNGWLCAYASICGTPWKTQPQKRPESQDVLFFLAMPSYLKWRVSIRKDTKIAVYCLEGSKLLHEDSRNHELIKELASLMFNVNTQSVHSIIPSLAMFASILCIECISLNKLLVLYRQSRIPEHNTKLNAWWQLAAVELRTIVTLPYNLSASSQVALQASTRTFEGPDPKLNVSWM